MSTFKVGEGPTKLTFMTFVTSLLALGGALLVSSLSLLAEIAFGRRRKTETIVIRAFF